MLLHLHLNLNLNLHLHLHLRLQVTGKADIKYGVGTTCGAAVGSTDVTFRHSTTELARQELKETEHYKTCMEQKASQEWATRTGAPYTTECWLTEVPPPSSLLFTRWTQPGLGNTLGI